MRYIESPYTDPALNLALEEYVFESLPRDESYFMLWRNENAVIVGKNQNTAEQIDTEYIKAHGVSVVRRLSGGGAVYHDLGNINFTFITRANEDGSIDLRTFCEPIVKTLEHFGVEAQVSGRNDITIDGRKFSGNAQYIKRGRVMHHGTIMFDSDLEAAAAALRVGRDKIESKGVDSVRSRITNVKPYIADKSVDIWEFWAGLKNCAMEWGGTPEASESQYLLSPDDIRRTEQIKAARYARWEWNFGKSPAFSIEKRRRIEGCGSVEIYMDVKNGVITGFAVYGDFFGTEDTTLLANALIGCRLEAAAVKKAISGLNIGRYISNMSNEQLAELILV